MVRDEPRDAPGGGASSDWMGGMSGLSLRFQKDMLDGAVGNLQIVLRGRTENCDHSCVSYIT